MENIALGAAAEVGKLTLGEAFDSCKEWVSYVNKYKKNIKQLHRLHKELETKQADVDRMVELGTQQNRAATGEARRWRDEAEALMAAAAAADGDWIELMKGEEAAMREGKRCCCLGVCRWNPKYRHDVSKRAEDKCKEIKELLEKLKQCSLRSLTIEKPPPSLENMHTDFYQGLESRMGVLEQIMSMLVDDGINVIGIHGMGGAGKTTLVKEVARQAVTKKIFNEVLFVEISQQPNIKEIQDQIAERINFPLGNWNSKQERALKLCERLKEIQIRGKKLVEDGKQDGEIMNNGKLLVIIDNIWEKLELYDIGIPYNNFNDSDCKIVLTSREEEVCKVMGATNDNILKVGMLHSSEAEQLFLNRVGDIVYYEEYKTVLENVLRNCPCLPLSINILADSLRNRSISDWEYVAQQLEEHKSSTGVFKKTYIVLHLSYEFIHDEGKKLFFLLCCLFPPGVGIKIHDLLRYGMGLGLFQQMDSLIGALSQVYRWARELKSSSLLMEVDSNKEEVKIHENVQEMGISFATKGNHLFHVGTLPSWLEADIYRRYTGYSLMRDTDYEHLAGMDLPQLQLLLLPNASPSKLTVFYFRGMPNIKVLGLTDSDFESLPPSINQLEILRTLLLENCSLSYISNIGSLTTLQILSFKNSNITSLPNEIGNLKGLKMLDLTNCQQLCTIHAGLFSKLSQLEGLYMRQSFPYWEVKENMKSLLELMSLPNLSILEIQIKPIEQLCDDNICIPPKLSSFKINVGGQDLRRSGGSLAQIKGGEVYSNLIMRRDTSFSRDLDLGGVHASHLMKACFKSFFNKAQNLFLIEVRGMTDVVPSMGDAPLTELQSIIVSGCDMKFLIDIKRMSKTLVIFPKLKSLVLYDLSSLREICHGKPLPNLFPYLQEVELSNLSILQPHALPIQVAAKIRVLKVVSCKVLKYIFLTPTSIELSEEESINDKVDFSSLRELKLIDLPQLQWLWEEGNETDEIDHPLFAKKNIFSCLEKIKLQSLNKIQKLWEIKNGEEFVTIFPKLRNIYLRKMPGIKHVWSNKVHGRNVTFTPLKDIQIFNCGSLKSVCSPSVACGFKELESLHIGWCNSLEQVISNESIEEDEGDIDSIQTISFPKLLDLQLTHFDVLSCFYRGSILIEFPVLEKLRLSSIDDINTFVEAAEDDGCQMLFNRKIVFPSLIELSLDYLFVNKLWDVTIVRGFSTTFHNLQRMHLSLLDWMPYLWSYDFYGESLIFVNLKELEIKSCYSLVSLFSVSNSYDTRVKTTNFPKLEYLELCQLPSFLWLSQGCLSWSFPLLKELKLKHLSEMRTFVKEETFRRRMVNYGALFDGKISFPSLENLELWRLDNITGLWDISSPMDYRASFPNIQSLSISKMPELRYLWRGELLLDGQNFGCLTKILVQWCENLKSLFSPISPQMGFQGHQIAKIISFPKLQNLELIDLESFKYIYPNRSVMEFKSLRLLFVKKLPMISSLVKLALWSTKEEKVTFKNQELKQLKLKKGKEPAQETSDDDLPQQKEDDNLNAIFKGNVEFPSLEELRIEYMFKLRKVYVIENEDPAICSSIFPRLKSLHLIGNSDNSEMMLKHFLDSTACRLSSLSIHKLHQMRSLVSSANMLTEGALLKSFSSIRNLEELVVEDCDLLEELFEVESQDVTSLPTLKALELVKLHKLKNVPWHMVPNLQSVKIEESLWTKESLITATSNMRSLQLLEMMVIKGCEDMETIISKELKEEDHEVVFPQLKEVRLEKMQSLCTFSSTSRVLRFPSLVHINLWGCPMIGSCSLGRLIVPKLSKVEMNGKLLATDQRDIDVILQHQFHFDNSVAKHWPKRVIHMLHRDHTLKLRRISSDWCCGGCGDVGTDYNAYIYACNRCKFYLHPTCTLKENQFTEEPDEVKVGNNWPRSLKHMLHDNHELKLVMGRTRSCEGCGEHAELFSYCCNVGGCEFDLHPRCALDRDLFAEELNNNHGSLVEDLDLT